MNRFELMIYHFRIAMPLAYFALALLLPVLITLFLDFAEKKLHVGGTPFGILMLLLPAAEAVLLTCGWRNPTLLRFILCYIGSMALFFALNAGLNKLKQDVLPEKRFIRTAKSRNFPKLEKLFARDSERSWRGVAKLEPELRRELARFCLTSKCFGEEFYRLLIQYLEPETVRELLNDPACNPVFRVFLFDKSPKDASFTDWKPVLAYAETSPTAASVLRRNIEQVVAGLRYPDCAKELREIAAGLGKYSASVRRKAYAKIPKTDEAFRKRYCPYCGSTKIFTGYLGLYNDMYHYGCVCNNCGHKDSAPEGYGSGGKDFSVSFGQLM